jgi:hypothetical protein
MDFSKDELKSLLNMLRSPDTDNSYLAFQSLENSSLKGKTGELVLLFKFSKFNLTHWSIEAPKCHAILSKYFNTGKTVTSGECLSLLTSLKCSKHSIELFLELFVLDMIDMLDNLGYPTDTFDLQITLKDEQTR